MIKGHIKNQIILNYVVTFFISLLQIILSFNGTKCYKHLLKYQHKEKIHHKEFFVFICSTIDAIKNNFNNYTF